VLELIQMSPNWLGALSVALVRPNGVPERRQGEGPWNGRTTSRPRRLTDDLAWLRGAPDESSIERLRRLRDRAVLEAAGFDLIEDEGRP
jgi:hypothetical protein